MKISLQNFSHKNIKTIYIATTFTTIVVYILLLRSIYYLMIFGRSLKGLGLFLFYMECLL